MYLVNHIYDYPSRIVMTFDDQMNPLPRPARLAVDRLHKTTAPFETARSFSTAGSRPFGRSGHDPGSFRRARQNSKATGFATRAARAFRATSNSVSSGTPPRRSIAILCTRWCRGSHSKRRSNAGKRSGVARACCRRAHDAARGSGHVNRRGPNPRLHRAPRR